MIKKLAIIIVLCLATQVTFGWGVLGHRAVGKLAEIHLSKKAKKKLQELMGHESLAIAGTWMDDERSNDAYDYTHDWHWVTIPDGMTYETAEKNPNGDIIITIERLIAELEGGTLDKQQEVIHIRMLVHLIADLHMPLHVGTGEDKGGNDVKVKWFWNNSNLHRVWDAGMIDEKKFSYTELAQVLDNHTEEQAIQWRNDSVRDWAYESMSYRAQVYDLPDDNSINFDYLYKNWPTVELRLLQAGIRLAGVLNKIYG